MFVLSTLSARLAGIVREALGVLARLGPKGVVAGPVLVAIFNCVQRRLLRFERLMARVAAGRSAVVRRTTQPGARAQRVSVRRVSLVPRGHAWAVRMAQETAALGLQLQSLLAEPGVAALLERVPEAAAILRPLCRMLAATLPGSPEPPPKTPKPSRPRPPGDALWPGERVWRERWEATFARAYARQSPRAPP